MPRPAAFFLSLLLSSLAASASSLRAQAPCLGPDGLDGAACCSLVTPNLPLFPAASAPGLGVCWVGCQPSAQQDLKVEWDAPSSFVCSQYDTKLRVRDAGSGGVLLEGALHLDYTRTWFEASVAGGPPFQVWRFVAKVDLRTPAGTQPACPVPDCLPPNGTQPTAFFAGYLDYVLDCQAGGWQVALVLHHGCDFFQHKPGLSARPGSFHAGRSFAIVAPHTSANPFVPALLGQPGGPLVAEAMREVAPNGTAACVAESPVAGGQLTPFAAGCVCTFSANPPLQTLSVLTGKSVCSDPAGQPGAFDSLSLGFPTLPWLHLTATSLGSWTTAASYPGPERVWAEEGLFKTRYACSGEFFEVYYGAFTAGGFAVVPSNPTQPPSTFFLDLASNYTAPVTGPFPLPILGEVLPTAHVLYVNLP